jgi:hypothetical protein
MIMSDEQTPTRPYPSSQSSSTTPIIQQNALSVTQSSHEALSGGEGFGEKVKNGDLIPAAQAIGGGGGGGGGGSKPKLNKFAYSCELGKGRHCGIVEEY